MADRRGVDTVTPYRPLRRRARWTVALLVVGLVVDAVAVWSGLRERSLLADIAAGRIVSVSEANASDRRQALVGLVSGVVFTLTAAAFLAWLYRAYRNLDAISPGDREWRHGWAVGAWFVPVLNLWRPKQIVNATWRGGGVEQGKDAVPLWVGVWWAAWLVSQLLYNGALRLSFAAEEVDQLKLASGATTAADGSSFLAGAGAIAVVLVVTRRQERRAEAEGLAPEEVRVPLYRRGAAWGTLAGVAAALAVQGAIVAAFWPGAVDSDDPGADGASGGPRTVSLPFDEDFSDPALYPRRSGPAFVGGYADGQYRILVRQPNYYQTSLVHLTEPVGRIRLEVEATMREGSALDGYGLRCVAGATAYNARITAAGGYAITTVKDSGESILPAVGSGPFIEDARSRAALRFDCDGAGDRVRLRLWANGKLLSAAEDPLPGVVFTGVGFFTSSDSGDTDVRFDNFAVRG